MRNPSRECEIVTTRNVTAAAMTAIGDTVTNTIETMIATDMTTIGRTEIAGSVTNRGTRETRTMIHALAVACWQGLEPLLLLQALPLKGYGDTATKNLTMMKMVDQLGGLETMRRIFDQADVQETTYESLSATHWKQAPSALVPAQPKTANTMKHD
jgi:hypothetical protein